jgi:hypothetical protein
MDPQAMLALTVSGNLASPARSALPGAPVVVTGEPARRAARLRGRTAAVLHRAADVIAPPERFAAAPVGS